MLHYKSRKIMRLNDVAFKEMFGRKKRILYSEYLLECYFGLPTGSLNGKVEVMLEVVLLYNNINRVDQVILIIHIKNKTERKIQIKNIHIRLNHFRELTKILDNSEPSQNLNNKWEEAYRTQNNNLNGYEYNNQQDSNIIPYSQHEIDNYSNGKVTVMKSNEDVIKFVEASTKVPSNTKLYFGKIGINVSNKIKISLRSYINITSYNISLQTNAVKHIFKNHGDSKYESNRGQVAITYDDFPFIPLIVSEHDKVSKIGTVENNNQALLFEKQLGDNYYLVSYISNKNHNLEIKTMYKVKANKKNSATASDALMPRSETPETDSGTSPFSGNTLSQNNDKVKLPTDYSMQKNRKNAKVLENSSFSL